MSSTTFPPQDERTLGGRGAGEDSTFFVSSSSWGHTLPDGLRLGEFEIQGLIGEGGFGIVYLAYDHLLQRRVALKEYMPSSIAARAQGGMTVVVKSAQHAEAFAAGLRSFVNEARLLAQFDHPSLVKVHRFWEDHGTAYMVMPYYEGATLKRTLAERAEPPDEATLRAWLRPLLDALALLHRSQCYHRDIAPDNILLTPAGPLLLDFGAARRVIGDLTHALTVVLKPSYAPIEQYGADPAMAQGPWTDLYALASVVYFAITGKPPMPSVDRLLADRLVPLSQRAAGRYGAGFLRAIDAALALKPQDRPQDVARFVALLDAPASMLARRTPLPQRWRRFALPSVATLAAGAVALAAWWAFTAREPSSLQVTQTEAAPAPAPGSQPPKVAPDAGEPVARVEPTAAPPLEPQVAPPVAWPQVVPEPWPPSVPQAAPKAAEPRRVAARAEPRPRPVAKRGLPPRCSDILQKASLEDLSTEEAAFLRKECQ